MALKDWKKVDEYHSGKKKVRVDFRNIKNDKMIMLEFIDIKTGWIVRTDWNRNVGLSLRRNFKGGYYKQALKFAKSYMRKH